jgi:4-hydroxy-tetrahydrodipicolinate synthase
MTKHQPALDRRGFLKLGFAAMYFALPDGLRADAARQLEGVFPILQTPFTDGGALDTAALAAEVRFCDRIGVQGVVWPQLASEYSALSTDERFAGAEAVVHATRSLAGNGEHPAVVIGVQGPDTESAVRYARHAAKLEPDAIVAIPLDTKDLRAQFDYYRAIAAGCNRPLFVQTVGDMSVDFVLEMAREIPTLRYVKDEAGQTLPRISDYRARGGDLIRGVFTGAHGRTLMDELARGSTGTMPAAGFADLYVSAWKAWRAGKRGEAMDMFSKVLLLVTEVQAFGLPSMKYILQLRGVFPNTKCRLQGGAPLDDQAQKSIRETYEFVKPYLKS